MARTSGVAVLVQPVKDVVTHPLRVALLRPPVVISLRSVSHLGPMPSVGIAYVATAVREAGHDVQVIDSPAEAMENFEEFDVAIGAVRRIGLTPLQMVDRIRPGTRVIGVTHMFAHEWPTVRELVELAHQRHPDAVILVGGENATGFWPWMFEQTNAIDAVVLGEVEATTQFELLARVSAGLPIDGMAVRGGTERDALGAGRITGDGMSSARPSSCSWSGSGRNPPICSICGNASETAWFVAIVSRCSPVSEALPAVSACASGAAGAADRNSQPATAARMSARPVVMAQRATVGRRTASVTGAARRARIVRAAT